jgi:hypothetical protein
MPPGEKFPGQELKKMADFVQKANVKRSVRVLATPIPDITTLNTLVQNVLDTNPFQCLDFIRSGVSVPGVSRGNEAYTVRIVYEDVNAKNVGNVTARARTVTGLNGAATALLADVALAAAIGGTAVRDTGNESYSAVIKCHDANGEDYTVTISRKTLTISSYEDANIVTRVDTWADTKPVLA